jgi:hypothetical protein
MASLDIAPHNKNLHRCNEIVPIVSATAQTNGTEGLTFCVETTPTLDAQFNIVVASITAALKIAV